MSTRSYSNDGKCSECGDWVTPDNYPYWVCEECGEWGFFSEDDPFDGNLWDKIDGD